MLAKSMCMQIMNKTDKRCMAISSLNHINKFTRELNEIDMNSLNS